MVDGAIPWMVVLGSNLFLTYLLFGHGVSV